ncbi:MAG TPA: hypothetical protein VH165_08995 [Kofleriaceae bacterium]|nr:hypothetical protein [Kofleriaceae bacterium]
MKLALALAAPLAAGATTYAVAQGTGASADQRAALIQKYDQNGDGKLDDNERAQMKAAFAAKRAARHQAALAKYDTNRDGKLEPSERVAMRDDKLTKRFQRMDQNGDGALSLDEFKAGAKFGHRHGRHGRGRLRGAAAGAPMGIGGAGTTGGNGGASE